MWTSLNKEITFEREICILRYDLKATAQDSNTAMKHGSRMQPPGSILLCCNDTIVWCYMVGIVCRASKSWAACKCQCMSLRPASQTRLARSERNFSSPTLHRSAPSVSLSHACIDLFSHLISRSFSQSFSHQDIQACVQLLYHSVIYLQCMLGRLQRPSQVCKVAISCRQSGWVFSYAKPLEVNVKWMFPGTAAKGFL